MQLGLSVWASVDREAFRGSVEVNAALNAHRPANYCCSIDFNALATRILKGRLNARSTLE